jgi:hypothetical protein
LLTPTEPHTPIMLLRAAGSGCETGLGLGIGDRPLVCREERRATPRATATPRPHPVHMRPHPRPPADGLVGRGRGRGGGGCAAAAAAGGRGGAPGRGLASLVFSRKTRNNTAQLVKPKEYCISLGATSTSTFAFTWPTPISAICFVREGWGLLVTGLESLEG